MKTVDGKLPKDQIADFSMIWNNLTEVDFILGWECNVDLGNLIQSPIPEPNSSYHLKPNQAQTLSWYQGFSSVFQEQVDGNITIWPVDTDKETSEIIGVQIHVPRQFAEIGTAPYYQVGQSDSMGAGFSWTDDYTSEGYKFANIPPGIGSIVVEPSASHTSLTMVVNINSSDR
jgi:hypothetical protein